MPCRMDDGYEVPSLPAAVAVRAHALLCERRSEAWRMMDGRLVFGEEQGSRFDLSFDDDGSADLSARIDLRGGTHSFISAVCELASKLDCLLFSVEHWAAIEPSPAALSAAVSRSAAARFMADPKAFLEGMR